MNHETAQTHMTEFVEAGLPGCVGSTDATHVALIRCPAMLRNYNMGHKLDLPTRTYNLTTNHRRRILSTTHGHPGRWNDKTLQLFDEFVTSIHAGKILGDDVVFELLERNADGQIVTRRYKGAWLIVDNGYLNWSITIPPFKDPITYQDLRWSKWLESMRKDVECVFGMLKGRFRLLKTGIRLHSLKSADQIWLTCCAMHNYLLEADGLHLEWQQGIPSDYERDLGKFRRSDLEGDVPDHLNHADLDLSGMGVGGDVCSGDPYFDPVRIQPGQEIEYFHGCVVRKMSQEAFRNK